MSFTRKEVGNLVFNQSDGKITHKVTGEELARFPSKFATPFFFITEGKTIAIDSTGVKFQGGLRKLLSEKLKFLTEGRLIANADAPSATDAVVDVELYCVNCASVIAKVTYSGEGGEKSVSISKSTLQAHENHNLRTRLNVKTASGTSGATQNFTQIDVNLIYDLTR